MEEPIGDEDVVPLHVKPEHHPPTIGHSVEFGDILAEDR